MKLLVVFNPHAAAGRAARLLPEIRSRLGAFAAVEILHSNAPGHASELVAGAKLDAYDGLIAAGGDGTLFEVLNGLYSQPARARIPLGLVPVGTGNAFARDLGLMPGDWARGIDIIGQGSIRLVDVGHVTMPSGQYHFLNIVGAGLPVDAMKTAEKIKLIGNSAYTLATLWRAMRLRTYPMVVEIAGETVAQESFFVEVSNTRYTGTSFLIAPEAVLDDGLLDVTLVSRLSRLRLLRLFPTIYRGGHLAFPEVTSLKAKTVVIREPENLALAPDGEFRGATPATIECLERDLAIFSV